MSGKPVEALVFKKCTGINDSTETTGPEWLEDGTTDLITSMNVTTTPEGKLVKVPAFSIASTLLSVIDELMGGKKLIAQAGNSLHQYANGNFSSISNSNVFTSGVKCKHFETPLDIRMCNDSVVYRIGDTSASLEEVTVGAYNGPTVSYTFNKMQEFDSGFVLNQKAYTIKDKIVTYSQDYAYDLYNLGDDFILNKFAIFQSGQIPGCFITTHAEGVTVYVGTGPNGKGFERKFYPCTYLNGSLWSGFISKAKQYGHIFLCGNGVHVVTADGAIENLTWKNTDSLATLNSVYNTAVFADYKYLAFGNNSCVEFDFRLGSVYLRSTNNVVASLLHQNKPYLASGRNLLTFNDTAVDESLPVSVKLPFIDYGIPQYKQIRFLYFTGTITGNVVITVRNEFGQSASKTLTALGKVQNYKIEGLRLCKGPKLSTEFNVSNGQFKLEELRAVVIPTSHRH